MSDPTAPDPSATSLAQEADPGAVAALTLIAAGALVSFARLADDAAHSPELRTRIVLSRMAAADLAPLDRVEQQLSELTRDAEAVDDEIWEFREVLAEYDQRTIPRDWWERLVRTYVGYGVVSDLEVMLAGNLRGESEAVAQEALGDVGLTDYLVATLRPVIDGDPQLAARLALWGRRVVGEAIGIASRLLQSHPELAGLAGVTGDGVTRLTPDDLAPVLNHLTAEHSRRMGRLGLTA